MTDRREAETEAEVRLRGVLEPDEEALDRVVRRVLGAGRAEKPDRAGPKRKARRVPLGRLRRRVLVPLAAGLAVVAVLAALLPGGSHPTPAGLSGTVASSASVTHRDGVLIVHRLDGGTSLLDARAGRPAAPRGTTIILKKGDRP